MFFISKNKLITSIDKCFVRSAGGNLPRGLEGDAGDLLAQRSRFYDGLFKDVRKAVFAASAAAPQRSHCHGRVGHVERCHVPAIRRRHQHGVPMRQGKRVESADNCLYRR